jgi:hypothetical protein
MKCTGAEGGHLERVEGHSVNRHAPVARRIEELLACKTANAETSGSLPTDIQRGDEFEV